MTPPRDYMAEARGYMAANTMPTGDALYLRAATEWGQIVVDLAQYLVGRRSANYARDCAVRLLACCLARNEETLHWWRKGNLSAFTAPEEISRGMACMEGQEGRTNWHIVAAVLRRILTALDAPTPPPGWEVKP